MSGKKFFVSVGLSRGLIAFGCGMKSKGVFIAVVWPLAVEIGWGYP